jgi:glucuronate isomerase
MKKFMDQDFLLETETAKTLFHQYAEAMPIFDYHSHISAQDIYEDKQFSTITEAWLAHDHYKWRAMRANGIPEQFITGDATDREKFAKWAQTIPYLIGNPLYHWTHLELQRYFHIDTPLDASTADRIYETCNAKLKTKEMSVRNLVQGSNVYALCTTDDPADDLHYHRALKKKEFPVKVLPTYRPDGAVHIQKAGFPASIQKLAAIVGYPLHTIEDLEKALLARMHFFHETGARVSDHGLDEMMVLDCTPEEANGIYCKGLQGAPLTRDELRKYQGYLLTVLGREYHKLGWVMQLHIGPMRNNSTRKFRGLGPDIGCDSINDGQIAQDLSRFLDALDRTDELPKTVLYCLNPKDNEVLASMAGNFQGEGIPGKIQFGSAWWFNDQIDGMNRQMEALGQIGLISKFIGMLTDSRSFLSYPRHEYFRRILCNRLGHLIESGQYPAHLEFVGRIVQDICFNNVKAYIPVE